MANTTVTINGIADSSIDDSKLATNAVTNTKILDGAIDYDKLAAALLASQAEAEAGTISNKLMTPLTSSQAIAALETVPIDLFTDKFTSAEQTITLSSGITVAHGLGAQPFIAHLAIICKISEHGHAVGDIVHLFTGADTGTTGRTWVPQITTDGTNMYIATPNTGISVIPKTGGTAVSITLASWRLIAKAWI